jgi:hypothetical protein
MKENEDPPYYPKMRQYGYPPGYYVAKIAKEFTLHLFNDQTELEKQEDEDIKNKKPIEMGRIIHFPGLFE